MSVRPLLWLAVGILISTPSVVLAYEVHRGFIFLSLIGGGVKAYALYQAYDEGRAR